MKMVGDGVRPLDRMKEALSVKQEPNRALAVGGCQGVESTARFAYELGFNQVFAEDAMTDTSEEAHKVSVEYVLKRMGKVRNTETILGALR
jgi:isochorismate hydrolase